jgi:hypothetical protein
VQVRKTVLKIKQKRKCGVISKRINANILFGVVMKINLTLMKNLQVSENQNV